MIGQGTSTSGAPVLRINGWMKSNASRKELQGLDGGTMMECIGGEVVREFQTSERGNILLRKEREGEETALGFELQRGCS
jgi:hypothetical protein